MKLFDLHCDTLFEMHKKGENLWSNSLDVSLEKAQNYEEYAQIFAIWSDNTLAEEECYQNCLTILKESRPLFDTINDGETHRFWYGVEGGRLLNNDLSRLSVLYQQGVRFFTLVWSGLCAIGGAHDTDCGFTEFGYKVLKTCFSLGIIPDLSHASDVMFYEAAEEAEKRNCPIIASHSNSRYVFPHTRNLTDAMFRRICDLGGIVGISMATIHLTDETCTIDHVIRHIDHYLSLGGEEHLCLGCDFDGVAEKPKEIQNLADLYKLANELVKKGYKQSLVERIFYTNAQNFVTMWIKE